MKNYQVNIVITLLLIFFLLLLKYQDTLPWWVFSVPVLLLGIFFPHRKWQVHTFLTGFIAGFTVWVAMNVYFNAIYPGKLIERLQYLFGIKQILIFLLSGVLGGILTGLSFYTGKSIVTRSGSVNPAQPDK